MEALAPERRRRLRSLAPCGSAGLRPVDGAGGPPLLDLASNDYLGLAHHPSLQQAASAAMARDGLGAGASRLVSGSRPVHGELEQALGAWLGRPRVLLFPSGFQANLAAVQALADRHSLVLADRLIHHSLLTGVKASGARLRRFPHNNLEALAQQLERAQREVPGRRLLVLSESLFSMEGTSPDVPALAELCRRHGAALLLDEAHALGVLGPILPLLGGEDGRALELQRRLEAAGLLSVAIRPPTVPEGSARLRLVLRHDLPAGSLERLLAALGSP
ncbi:MAG: aminotransferase class I/II-fold pyridoxal phosphate-dependent enzyme [Vulcanococcus sp.]